MIRASIVYSTLSKKSLCVWQVKASVFHNVPFIAIVIFHSCINAIFKYNFFLNLVIITHFTKYTSPLMIISVDMCWKSEHSVNLVRCCVSSFGQTTIILINSLSGKLVFLSDSCQDKQFIIKDLAQLTYIWQKGFQ